MYENVKKTISFASWIVAPVAISFIKDSLFKNAEHIVTVISLLSFSAGILGSQKILHGIAILGGIAYAHNSQSKENEDFKIKDIEDAALRFIGYDKNTMKSFQQYLDQKFETKSSDSNVAQQGLYLDNHLVNGNQVQNHD